MPVGLEVDPQLGTDANAALNPPAGQPDATGGGAATPAAKPGDGAPAGGGAPGVGAPPAGGTPAAGADGQQPSQAVPYERFKEINDRLATADRLVANYERMLAPHQQRIVRDPSTGQWTLSLDGQAGKPAAADELTEQDYAVFDSLGWKQDQQEAFFAFLEKALGLFSKQMMGRFDEKVTTQRDSASTWAQCLEEFPDLKDRTSALYKRANEIYVRDYLGKGRNYPEAQYDAVLKAERQLSREKSAAEKGQAAAAPVQKQNQLVGAQAGKGARKGKVTPEEFERMTPEEQEVALREASQFPEGGIGG